MKLSIIILAGLAAAACLRSRSAALRHWVIAVAIACAGVMPVLVPFLPASPLQFGSAPIVPGFGRTAPADASISVTVRPGETTRSGVPSAPRDTVMTGAVWLSGIWLAGSVISLGILGIGLARVAWLTSRARPPHGRWLSAMSQIADDQKFRRRVRLVESSHPAILATWGATRPTIILPAGASAWPDDLMRVILHHELAHIRRGDWLIQIAGELLRSVYWFNPLVWIACARLRAESEQACDDDVLNRGVEPPVYAGHLVSLARTLGPDRSWIPAPAMARPSTLHRRVAAMLNSGIDRRPLTLRGRLATLALLLAATVAVAAAQSSSTLSGTVVDPQGAGLPGVRVTLMNVERQTSQDAETNRSGQFQFTSLPMGDYVVRVQVPGFQSYQATVSAMTTNIVQTIALQLGQVRETVNVDDGDSVVPATSAAPARLRPPCGQQPATGQVRIGGNVRAPVKLKDVRPVYPASLRGTGTTAEVVLDAVIGTDGFIHDIRARDGSQQPFVDAFIAAVTQWQFDSTLLNCVPVETPITITGRFAPQR